MTMDEACLILNVKKDTPMEGVLKVCRTHPLPYAFRFLY